MKRRNKLYTPRDVLLSLILAIIFILWYLGAWASCAIVSSDNLSKSIEQFELVEMLSWLWWFLSPILIIISLYMCIERYLYVELRSGEKMYDTKGRMRIYASIAVIILLGIEFFRNMLYVIGYFISYLDTGTGFGDGIVILFLIAVCWLIGLAYAITKGRAIFIQHGMKDIRSIIVVILLIALIVFSRYGLKK